MPYKSISELPSGVRNSLPPAAQRLWMSAFNSAYAKSKSDSQAAQYAWGTVKKVYSKKGDKWVKKNNLDLSSEKDDMLLEWVAHNLESLQLKTSDIVDALPKRFWEVPVRHGIRLSPHHGKLLWEGVKTSITSYKDWQSLLMEPLHLIEDNVCYGTIRFTNRREVKNQDDAFFVYDVDWLKRFPGPLPVKLRKKDETPYTLERGQYTFTRLDRLSTQDVLWIHAYCHTGHNDSIKEFHDIIAIELEDRGMIHPIYAPLDENIVPVQSPVAQVPSPQLQPGKITIDDFLDALPEQFSIEEPPAQIWLTGDIVNQGWVNDNDIIDVIIKQDSPDMRIPRKLVRDLKNIDLIRVHPVFTSDEPRDGIPLYRSSYQRLPIRSSVDNAKLKKMVPKTQEFSKIQDIWDDWTSTRIDNGVIVYKKYNGTSALLRYNARDKNVEIRLTDGLKYDEIDRSREYPSLVNDLSKCTESFVASGEIVYYNCNNMTVNDKEELCTPIDSSLIHKVPNDCDVVFHINELLYSDGEPVYYRTYSDRLHMMNDIIPHSAVHIKVVPYSICNTHTELQSAVATLSKLPGSEGIMMREAASPYLSHGKSTHMADLSSSYSDSIILDNCKYVGSKTCALNNLSHVPVKCSIASLCKCPFLKEEVYDIESNKVELKNWKLLEIEPDS